MKIELKEVNDSRSFEERVFARFDRVEIRITSLEDRQYDTKPIWERVLAELAELRAELETRTEGLRKDLRSEFQAGIEGLRTDLHSKFQAGIEGLRTDLHSEFQAGIEGLRTDLHSEFQAGIEGLRTDLRSEFQAGIDGLRTEMKAGFVSVRHQLEHELRGVARKMDVLNQTFFQIQADQRYVDRRLEYLETQKET